MKSFFRRFYVILSLALLAGCSGIPVLPEPIPVPGCGGDGYQVKVLSERKPRYAMAFDYSGCVEDAVVSSSGFSGKTSICGTFCARKIIEREFDRAAKANFTQIVPGQKVDGVVYVETEKLLVSKSWSKYSVETVFDIEVFCLSPSGRHRIFRKKYRLNDMSQEKGGSEAIPLCVYSCVQQAVRLFVEDMAMCQGIANFIKNNE